MFGLTYLQRFELLQLKYLDLEIERDQLLDRVQAMAVTLEEYRKGLEKWKRIASVICQITFQVFGGFLSFPGFRKPGNLEMSKICFSELHCKVFNSKYSSVTASYNM